MSYAVLYNSTVLIFPNNISKTPQHSGRSGVQTDTCMISYLWVEVHGQSVGDISYLWVEVHGQSVGGGWHQLSVGWDARAVGGWWVTSVICGLRGMGSRWVVGDISFLWVEMHGQSVGGGWHQLSVGWEAWAVGGWWVTSVICGLRCTGSRWVVGDISYLWADRHGQSVGGGWHQLSVGWEAWAVGGWWVTSVICGLRGMGSRWVVGDISYLRVEMHGQSVGGGWHQLSVGWEAWAVGGWWVTSVICGLIGMGSRWVVGDISYLWAERHGQSVGGGWHQLSVGWEAWAVGGWWVTSVFCGLRCMCTRWVVGDISYLWVERHGQSVGGGWHQLSMGWEAWAVGGWWVTSVICGLRYTGSRWVVGDISYLWVEMHGQSVGGGWHQLSMGWEAWAVGGWWVTSVIYGLRGMGSRWVVGDISYLWVERHGQSVGGGWHQLSMGWEAWAVGGWWVTSVICGLRCTGSRWVTSVIYGLRCTGSRWVVGDISYLWVERHGQSVGGGWHQLSAGWGARAVGGWHQLSMGWDARAVGGWWVTSVIYGLRGMGSRWVVGDISYLWVERHGQSVGDISYLWVEVHAQSVGGGWHQLSMGWGACAVGGWWVTSVICGLGGMGSRWVVGDIS